MAKKVSRKKPNTPRSRVKHYLRLLWLRSRERAKCLKDADRCCTECGVKQSAAKGREVKLEVHHLKEIKWEKLIDLVFEMLLDAPQTPLCKGCHAKETEKQGAKREMVKYKKIYMDYHGYGIDDTILCENCGGVAVDIHHIEPRGMGGNPKKDTIGNLIALCRPCHEKAEAGKITKESLFEIVNLD